MTEVENLQEALAEAETQPGALLAMIRDLQQRVTWYERQHRMLLIALGSLAPGDRPLPICVDSRCLNGPVPHMAEQPYGCPRLT